jgi:hypothetical protein
MLFLAVAAGQPVARDWFLSIRTVDPMKTLYSPSLATIPEP